MRNAFVASVMLAFFFNSINSTDASNSVLSSGTWYKLSASETGIYVITYNDLLSLGIPASTIDPRNISLYGNGPGELPQQNSAPRPDDLQEIAIEVKGESDGVFDVGDTIFFYNHSQITWTRQNGSQFVHHLNHYSDSCYYFLTVGSVQGKRIPDQQSLPTFTTTTSSSTDYSIHESEQINFLHSGKVWFGENFSMGSGQTQSFPLMIDNLSSGDSVFINVNFAGRDTIGITSLIMWTLNGFNYFGNIPQVGTTPQDNYVGITNSNHYVLAPLSSDSITLTFQSGNTNAEGWLNFIEVNAIRNLIFDQSPVCFRDLRKVGSGEIVKYNLTANAGIKIWDVTSFNDVKNQLYTVSAPFLNFNSAADSLREFIAFDGSNFLQPQFIGTVSNQNLHSVSQKNMIIVTDKDFVNEATTLAQYHQAVDGLSTVVVSSDEIFNEYSSGAQDPVAIRDFIRQIYFSSTGADSLKYVLLFGASSYDYKNILGFGKAAVPTHQSDGSINLTQTYCSDDFFALMDSTEGYFANNEISDVAIGRIPVKTAQDAQVVNKIISYNLNSDFGVWRTKVTSVADDQDYNIHATQVDTLANRIETYDCGLNSNKIYIDAFVQHHDSVTNKDTYPDANLKIQEVFQEGTAVIQYMGHGNSQGWADEKVLEYEFLDTVNNSPNLPVIVSGTATFNVVDDPSVRSAAEAALLNQNGGCIASIAASRLTYSSSNFNFMTKMIREIFSRNSGQWPTLGDAFLNTKKGLYNDLYIRNTSLLGDPAVRILFPLNEVVVTTVNPDTISSGQTVQISGAIQNSIGSLISSFNGPIDITFFNPKSSLMTLGNDSLNSTNPGFPFSYQAWDDTVYSTTVNVINGLFTLNFTMPFNIDSSGGVGRIAFYANDGVTDAMGCYQNVVYRDLTQGISEYLDLQIQLFPNPSTDQIKCVLNDVITKDWSYLLIGSDGKKIQREKILSQEFFINRKSLASGIYFLKIVDDKNKVVAFKKLVFE